MMIYAVNSTRVQAPAFIHSQMDSGTDDPAGLNLPGRPVGDSSSSDGTPKNTRNTKKRLLGARKEDAVWIGTLNVRTCRKTSVRLELVDRFLDNGLEVLGVQEHRVVHSEDLKVEHHQEGVRFISVSAWRNGSGASVGGVGALVSRKAYDSICLMRGFGSRILLISFSGNPRTSVVVVNSPTEAASDEEAEEVHQNLRDAIATIPAHDMLLVVGDLNAKLRDDVAGFTYHSSTNRNGQLLLETNEECNLEPTNIRFQRKPEKRWTFLSNGLHTKALLDYVLVRRKWKSSVKDSRVTNSFASVGSDHRAVICRVQMSFRKKKRMVRKVVYDVSPLSTDQDLRDRYAVSVRNRFDILQDGCEDVLSATIKYSWFTDAVHHANEQHLKPIAKRKKINAAKDPRVASARAKVIAAKESFNKDQHSTSQEAVTAAKDLLSAAYTEVEEEEVSRMTRKAEEPSDLGKS